MLRYAAAQDAMLLPCHDTPIMPPHTCCCFDDDADAADKSAVTLDVTLRSVTLICHADALRRHAAAITYAAIAADNDLRFA